MRRNVLVTIAVLAIIAIALYAAYSMDWLGMILRAHDGGTGHGW